MTRLTRALRHSAGYLRQLCEQFGNLGLAAAAYNAGPGRVSAWLVNHRLLPGETRNYVAMVTGWTADEWASPSPPKMADTTIPQGVPCTRLANLVSALTAEEKHRADAKEHIAAPIDGRPDSVRSREDGRASDDDESTAQGGEKSAALSILEPSAPQVNTSPQTNPQADGAASASATPRPDSKAVVTVKAQERISVAIDARVRPTADARASIDAESTATGGERTALSSPESPAAQGAPRPDASPMLAIPRWGVWLAANPSESKAWALLP